MLVAFVVLIFVMRSFFEESDISVETVSSWTITSPTSGSEILWQVSLPLSSISKLMDANSSNVVITIPNQFLALELNTGEELWRYDLSNPVGLLALPDEVGYIVAGLAGAQTIIARLNNNGNEIWSTSVDAGMLQANLWFADDTVYLPRPQ